MLFRYLEHGQLTPQEEMPGEIIPLVVSITSSTPILVKGFSYSPYGFDRRPPVLTVALGRWESSLLTDCR